MKQMERIGWLAAVLAVVAWHAASNTRHDEPLARLAADPAPSRPTRDGSPEGRTPQRRPRPAGGHSSGVAATGLTALRSADPVVRMTEFLKLLTVCDASNIEEAAAALEELKTAGISLPAEESLLNFRAGQLKGAEMFATRTRPPADPEAMPVFEKQYEGWALTDPQAAGRWLDELPPGKYRDRLAVNYVASCAKDDPGRSLELVSSMHASQQTAAGRALGQRLAESSSPEEASTLLKELASRSGPEESRYLKAVFDTISTGPAAATMTSFAEENLDQPFVTPSALARVSEERAKNDPVAALEWAEGLEDRKPGIPQGEIQAAAIQGMTLEGISQAERWISTQAGAASAHLWKALETRRESLEEDRAGANEYDKDD